MDETLHVTVECGGGLYALPASTVERMAVLPDLVTVPLAPPTARGAMNLRGLILPAIDLRAVIGWGSQEAERRELTALLQAREQDHLRWLAELETCVREGTEFKLATDPHRCAFGQWYDNYRADHWVLAYTLRRFELPHALIHAIAAQCLRLAAEGRQADAIAVIDETRETHLAAMIRLFAEARDVVSQSREVAVVVHDGIGRPYALIVDGVHSVSSIQRATGGDEGLGLAENPLVEFVGRRADGATVLVLDLHALRRAISDQTTALAA